MEQLRPTPPKEADTAVVGRLEHLAGLYFTGWAVHPEKSDTPVTVDVLCDDRLIATIQTGIFRPDLHKIYGGRGNYGFRVKLPTDVCDGHEHVIKVVSGGTKTLLDDGERKIQLEPDLLLEGFFENMRGLRVRGWAWNSMQPDAPVEVEVLDGGTPVMAVLADLYREDLVKAGKGNGLHAFDIELPGSLCDNRPHEIRIRVRGVGYELRGGPKTLLVMRPEPIDVVETGLVEAISGMQVSGWVRAASLSPEHRKIDILEGDRLLVRVNTEPPPAGSGPFALVKGLLRFSATLPYTLADGLPHQLRVATAEQGAELDGSPIFFQVNNYFEQQAAQALRGYDSLYVLSRGAVEENSLPIEQLLMLAVMAIPVHVVSPKGRRAKDENMIEYIALPKRRDDVFSVAAIVNSHKQAHGYKRALVMYDDLAFGLAALLIPSLKRYFIGNCRGDAADDTEGRILYAIANGAMCFGSSTATPSDLPIIDLTHSTTGEKEALAGRREDERTVLVPMAVDHLLDIEFLYTMILRAPSSIKFLIVGEASPGLDTHLQRIFEMALLRGRVKYLSAMPPGDEGLLPSICDAVLFPLNHAAHDSNLETEFAALRFLAAGVPVAFTRSPVTPFIRELATVESTEQGVLDWVQAASPGGKPLHGADIGFVERSFIAARLAQQAELLTVDAADKETCIAFNDIAEAVGPGEFWSCVLDRLV